MKRGVTMVKIGVVLISIAILFSSASCVSVSFGNQNGYGPIGAIFSSYKIGLSGSDMKAAKGKQSSACLSKILFFVLDFDGGGGVPSAARKGGIVKIYSVDFEVTSFFWGIYSEACTVITGE